MAQLMAEMTIKIHPEMTEEGKELLRQMIREEIEKIMREAEAWSRLQNLPPVEEEASNGRD